MLAHLVLERTPELRGHGLHHVGEVEYGVVAAQVGEDVRQHVVQEVMRAGLDVFVHLGDPRFQRLHHLKEEVQVAPIAIRLQQRQVVINEAVGRAVHATGELPELLGVMPLQHPCMHNAIPGRLHGIGGFSDLGQKRRQLLLSALLSLEGGPESILGILQLGPEWVYLFLERVTSELEANFLSCELVALHL